MRIKIDINLKKFSVNPVIRRLIISDLILLGGWGLIGPILSIFVIQKIPGATLMTVGIVSAIYWLGKSIIQIPVSLYLDKHEGEKDDFYALILGLTIAGFTALMFTIVKSVLLLYLVALFQAIAFGLYLPSWSAIFSRHLDKSRFSFDWSLDSTAVGIASGVAGFLSGIIAYFLGFEAVFVFTAILSFISAAIIFLMPDLVMPKSIKSTSSVIKDHFPQNINK